MIGLHTVYALPCPKIVDYAGDGALLNMSSGNIKTECIRKIKQRCHIYRQMSLNLNARSLMILFDCSKYMQQRCYWYAQRLQKKKCTLFSFSAITTSWERWRVRDIIIFLNLLYCFRCRSQWVACCLKRVFHIRPTNGREHNYRCKQWYALITAVPSVTVEYYRKHPSLRFYEYFIILFRTTNAGANDGVRVFSKI